MEKKVNQDLKNSVDYIVSELTNLFNISRSDYSKCTFDETKEILDRNEFRFVDDDKDIMTFVDKDDEISIDFEYNAPPTIRYYEPDSEDEQRTEFDSNTKLLEYLAYFDYIDDSKAFDSYFENVLDINYTIHSDGDFKSCRVAISLGGPNIYIDTADREVQGYWGFDRYFAYLDNDICDSIDDYFEAYYQLVRNKNNY